MFWIAAGSVLVVLVVIGALASRADRKNAPGELTRARAAWGTGQRGPTLEALRGAFYDSDGTYSSEEAKVAQEALALLDTVLSDSGINPAPLTAEARAALSSG